VYNVLNWITMLTFMYNYLKVQCNLFNLHFCISSITFHTYDNAISITIRLSVAAENKKSRNFTLYIHIRIVNNYWMQYAECLWLKFPVSSQAFPLYRLNELGQVNSILISPGIFIALSIVSLNSPSGFSFKSSSSALCNYHCHWYCN